MQNEVVIAPGLLEPYRPNVDGFYELHLVAIGPLSAGLRSKRGPQNPLTVNRTTDCIYPQLGGKLRFNRDGSKR